MKAHISEICEDAGIDLSYNVSSEEKSCGDVLRCSNAAVVGIPAQFFDAPCQAVKKNIQDDIKKLINSLLIREID